LIILVLSFLGFLPFPMKNSPIMVQRIRHCRFGLRRQARKDFDPPSPSFIPGWIPKAPVTTISLLAVATACTSLPFPSKHPLRFFLALSGPSDYAFSPIDLKAPTRLGFTSGQIVPLGNGVVAALTLALPPDALVGSAPRSYHRQSSKPPP
jgi:hypothetical protein